MNVTFTVANDEIGYRAVGSAILGSRTGSQYYPEANPGSLPWMGTRRSLDDYPAIMDSADVAELLGHTVKQIQVMCRADRLPGERPAGSHEWRFRRDELLAWMHSDQTRVNPR